MWRSFGVKHVHLTWGSIQPALGRMTRSQQDWFEEVNAAVRLLNAKEVVTRKAIRMAQELNGED
ncbi:MAG: hypothetical protein J0I63_03570 [Thiobacillus sp.]|nr:hypothetical protein [Thiobacillus sp.]